MIVVAQFDVARALPGALAFLVGVAGWFYLFYSRAASNLAFVEATQLNQRRVWLRRIGGTVMLLLAVGIAVGFYGFDRENPTVGFVWVWVGVMGLLLAMMCLGLMDLRLTWKLREAIRQKRQSQ